MKGIYHCTIKFNSGPDLELYEIDFQAFLMKLSLMDRPPRQIIKELNVKFIDSIPFSIQK